MTRLRVAAPSLALQLLAAFAGGACGVLAFAPVRWWPLALLSMAVLFGLWCREARVGRTFAIGFAWGLGLFTAGVSWIYVSLHVYGNMPAVLAAAATFLFCCYLSIYPALAGACARVLRNRFAIGPWTWLLLVVPACFVLFEYSRGWLLTGFPWLTMGYAQAPGGPIDVPLAGFAPVTGVHGISLLLALSAAVIVVLHRPASLLSITGRGRAVLLILTLVFWGGGAGLQHLEWSHADGPVVAVALIQGNIPQELKWRADQQEATLKTYAALVEQSRARLIVLPETALPGFLDQMPPQFMQQLQQHASRQSADLVVGVPIAERGSSTLEPYRYANSAISMGLSPGQRYDKQHLVAFGEFMPPLFSWVYRWLQIPLAGFTPGGNEQTPMAIAGTRVAVNICYEDAFGGEIARHAAESRLLVNMSNMAWYGESLAADQHAQFSQMRALETSRWMLRATNTGVTAAIDEHGLVVAALPQFKRGVLQTEAQPRKGVTPYARVGDALALGIAFLMLAMAIAVGRRASRAMPSL
jgi:apolipoprotein N-acyltransferase